MFPAWSPDGRFVAFYGSPSGIYTIPALGGQRRLLASVKVAERVAWFADGRRLALVDIDPETGFRSLYELLLDTNQRRKLVAGRSGWDIRSPAMSPDGDTLAYVGSPAGGVNAVFLLTPGEGAPRQLTGNDEFPDYQLSWSPEGEEILYCSRNEGLSTLWRKPVAGGESRRVDAAGYDVTNVAASPQSHQIAVVRESYPANLWSAPIDQPGDVTQVASTHGRQTSAQFSPDGRMLAFESNRSGASEIWTSDLSGRNLLQVTSIATERRTLAGTPRWSPDGSEIVFDARPTGNPDIYVVKAAGGPLRRITDSPAEDVVPSFSRDGLWIYFASNRSGSFEVWKTPQAGGEAVQMTRGGGFAPVESIDAKHVYFTKHRRIPGPGTLWRMPAEGGEPVQVLREELSWQRWGVARREVFHLAGDSRLMRTNPDTGSTQALGNLPPNTSSIAVSPDGRSLVYSRQEERKGNVFLLEGFR
jgi:Tol biopolymer transport system component